ncbi:MAG: GNAT family N-acetyltransferase [Chitinophagaceae bacterium]|nr:GNAT family N-acetyltransferase [Chitinophagaceae bacterium]
MKKYQRLAPWMFKTWVQWTVKFGKGYITEDENAVVLMRSPHNAKMTFWSMIRAGMLPTPFKLGLASFNRFYYRIVSTLDKKHAEIMGTTPHWYGWMIGVTDKCQHKGIGATLMNHCFNIADEAELPIYLETSVEQNVSLYHHKEFRIVDTEEIAEGKFKLYFMIRQPKKHTKILQPHNAGQTLAYEKA